MSKKCEERSKTALEERHKRDQKQLLQSLTKAETSKQRKMKAEMLNSQQKRKLRNQEQINRLRRELTTDSYKKMIGRFEQVFHSNLTEFMSLLSKNSDGHYNTHLFNLCIQLDYNSYLSHVIEK
jgi:superoxide dismutase